MNKNTPKNALLFLGAAVFLVLLALSLWNAVEIYPRPRFFPPSREARINDFLALDRWLKDTGHPVRLSPWGGAEDFESLREGTVFILSSNFDWQGEETAEAIRSWVEAGGNLVVSLEPGWEWEEDLEAILEGFGLTQKTDDDDDYAPAGDFGGPLFDSRVAFKRPAVLSETPPGMPRGITPEIPPDILVLEDGKGLVRVLGLPLGRGRLTVMGRPFCMYSDNLGRRQNAALAWRLLAGWESSPSGLGAAGPDTDAVGVLFYRGEKPTAGGFFGAIFSRGNWPPLLASVCLILIVGFWMIIPVFGILRGDDEVSGRPLQERFLAEGLFLKRYGALDSFRAMYLREIKRRLMKREIIRNEDEFRERMTALWKEQGGAPETGVFAVGKTLSPLGRAKAFRESVLIFTSILERL
jgi:hypothetical protein